MRVEIVEIGRWVRQLDLVPPEDDQASGSCVICLEALHNKSENGAHDSSHAKQVVLFPCECSNNAIHASCLIKYLLSSHNLSTSTSLSFEPQCPYCRAKPKKLHSSLPGSSDGSGVSSSVRLISANASSSLAMSARLQTREKSPFEIVSAWCAEQFPAPPPPSSPTSSSHQSPQEQQQSPIEDHRSDRFIYSYHAGILPSSHSRVDHEKQGE